MIRQTFDEVFTFEALYRAHIRGRCSKRDKRPIIRFEMCTLQHIYGLYRQLHAGKFKFGTYSLKHNAGSKTGGWYGSGNTDNMNQVVAKSDYNEWKDDYVWLPSLTETGYYNAANDNGTSLWGIPAGNAILNSSAISWVRSGACDV